MEQNLRGLGHNQLAKLLAFQDFWDEPHLAVFRPSRPCDAFQVPEKLMIEEMWNGKS
jgi:hypothetical protein